MSRLHPQSDPIALWRAIEQAGGVQAYVNAQLTERGFLVQRRETDKMSDREREAYKKSLKAEAEERRRLSREAWAAHKATHIVHLGEGVFWKEGRGSDKWDLPNAEARAAENELPPLDSAKQLAEALGLTIAELRRLAYHRDAATGAQLPAIHDPQAGRLPAGHLGPDAEVEEGPALDPAQHRREAPGTRLGARFPPRPFDAHQRRRARRPEARGEGGHQGLLPHRDAPEGQGDLPKGRISGGDRHATGPDLHRVSSRDRRAGWEDVLRGTRPALPAPGRSDEPCV